MIPLKKRTFDEATRPQIHQNRLSGCFSRGPFMPVDAHLIIKNSSVAPSAVKRARGDMRDYGISLSLRLRGGKGRVRGDIANIARCFRCRTLTSVSFPLRGVGAACMIPDNSGSFYTGIAS